LGNSFGLTGSAPGFIGTGENNGTVPIINISNILGGPIGANGHSIPLSTQPLNSNGMNHNINSHNHMVNIINSLFNGLESGVSGSGTMPNSFQDVVITVDDNDLEKLKSIKLESNIDTNCSVCMGHMVKDEMVTELKCSHLFHTDCIEPYLKQYNYKCPVCRAEVGKAKYNM
jgi:hypothetical protein